MKVCVLASGSKGNATYISTAKVKILVDLGTTSSYTVSKLNEIGVDASEIKAIILTHTHADHTDGLKVFLKHYNPTVYLTKKMYDEIADKSILHNYTLIDSDFNLADLEVEIFKTSHDVADSNGYIFKNNGKSLVYITDTGYIPIKLYDKLKNKTMYIMESNHDIEMLMNGRYPYYLKQRILGDLGHLSNHDSAYHLAHLIGKDTKEIILIHLSEENNDPTIAYDTLIRTLKDNDVLVEHIQISSQNDKTELVEV